MEPTRPEKVRVITFIDGQNLFRQAKRCFGTYWPDYDPIKISEFIALRYPDRELKEIRFYTGKPPIYKSRLWHWFWENKISAHQNEDERFIPFTLPLAYHSEEAEYINPQTNEVITETVEFSREKGIDVRIALDLVLLAITDSYDIAVIFSQDRDLSEAVKSVY